MTRLYLFWGEVLGAVENHTRRLVCCRPHDPYAIVVVYSYITLTAKIEVDIDVQPSGTDRVFGGHNPFLA